MERPLPSIAAQPDAPVLEPPDPGVVRVMVRRALAEDVGPGDITATAVVPRGARAVAHLVARTTGVLAGTEVAALAFTLVEPQVAVEYHRQDGARLAPGQRVLTVQGPARGILTAERVALNFVQRLSGIATLTDRYVAAIEGTRAAIVETRKTTPGLRALEKYAVRAGGGRNHRQALYDAILIKDNHLLVAGSVRHRHCERARAYAPHTMRVQVEVDTLAQVAEALAAGADAITFDNMSPEEAKTAARTGGRPRDHGGLGASDAGDGTGLRRGRRGHHLGWCIDSLCAGPRFGVRLCGARGLAAGERLPERRVCTV